MTKTLVPCLLALHAFATLGHAATGAAIGGTVKDPQGGRVAGVSLTLFSESGMEGSTTSNAKGEYRLDGLLEGDYLLRASAPGFAAFLAEDIHPIKGAVLNLEITLSLAKVQEQVVVTAASTPQAPEHVSKAVTVVDESQADVRNASSLADVVDLVPGVRVQQLGGPGAFTSIQVRGLQSYDTAVLVDGLRLRDASATQADASGLLEDLLFTDASSVEMMRGSGSSLYGTNAIGGVINVITDEGGGRTHGNLLLEGGSLGTFRGRAQLAGGLRKDRIQYSFGVADTDVTSGVGGDAPFRDLSAQGSMTFHLSPSIRLTGRLYGADTFSKVQGEPDILGSPSGLGIISAIPGNTFLPAPDNPDSTRAARFISAAMILNQQITPTLDYTLSYQLVSNGRRYGDGPAGVDYQPTSSILSHYDGRIQTLNAQAHYRLNRFNFISAGYEWESETYANDNTQQYVPAASSGVNVTQRSHTAFVQDQAKLFGDRLQISGAFRAQVFSLNTPIFAPFASAPYQGLTAGAPPAAYTGDGSIAYFFRKTETKLRAHLGRGYRAPSLFERFGAGFDPVFGYTVYGDPRLKPERSTGLDAGIDQTLWHGHIKASASYFYTWLDSVINFDTSGLINSATDPYARFIGYLNTKGGVSRGLELSATIAPNRRLNVTSAYTYVNSIDRTPVVGDVLQAFVVPKNQFSILATAQATSKLMLTVDTIQSSSYLAPVYGTFVTQTYRFSGLHKLNVGASYRIAAKEQHSIRLFVRAENILGQTYFENGFLTPGRMALGGFQIEF